MTKEKKVISRVEYHALLGYQAMAQRMNDSLANIAKEVASIVGESVDGLTCGYWHSEDFIFGGESLDRLLRVMNVEVEEEE